MLLDVVAHWHKVTTVTVITLCSLVTIQTPEAVVRVSNLSHWKTLRTGRVTVQCALCILYNLVAEREERVSNRTFENKFFFFFFC